jgi:hypothetical protein
MLVYLIGKDLEVAVLHTSTYYSAILLKMEKTVEDFSHISGNTTLRNWDAR